ncbi:MAG: DNA cytosine methyltransferase [Aquabacterium sp.]
MDSYLVRSVGTNRGALRLYLDGSILARSSFTPGMPYDIESSKDSRSLLLRRVQSGARVVSRKRKPGRSEFMPVIDINSDALLSVFGGGSIVRVVISVDSISITLIASELARLERLDRLNRSIQSRHLKIGSVAHGIGGMAYSAHAGLLRTGLGSELVAAVELDGNWLGHAIEKNPVWSTSTVAVAAPLQEFVQDPISRDFKVDVLELGIPCSGASRAGKAKRGLTRMEAHPEVGHLVVPALMLIHAWSPAVIVVENVKSYSNEASADLLRSMLADMGYQVQEACLVATDFGELERRERWFLVAVTRGIQFDITSVLSDDRSRYRNVRYVADVLDPIEDDGPEWSSFDYLDTKAVRDAEKGSNFANQTVDASDIEVPTLRKGYQKVGSTDPLLAHPTKVGLKRRFTVAEHARLKGQPEFLVEGLGVVAGHAALGQSVAFEPVARLFEEIGNALLKWGESDPQTAFHVPRYSLVSATG